MVNPPEELGGGMSQPTNHAHYDEMIHSRCEQINFLILDCLRSYRSSYDDVFKNMYPIPTFVKIIDSLLQLELFAFLMNRDELLPDFSAIFDGSVSAFSYFVLVLHHRIHKYITFHPSEVGLLVNLFNVLL